MRVTFSSGVSFRAKIEGHGELSVVHTVVGNAFCQQLMKQPSVDDGRCSSVFSVPSPWGAREGKKIDVSFLLEPSRRERTPSRTTKCGCEGLRAGRTTACCCKEGKISSERTQSPSEHLSSTTGSTNKQHRPFGRVLILLPI